MIDGIDYYPKKKKDNGKFMFWVLFLLIVGILVYWYLNDQIDLEKPKSTLIIISEPELKQTDETIPISAISIQDKQKYVQPQILENLDEVMQNYNKNKP